MYKPNVAFVGLFGQCERESLARSTKSVLERQGKILKVIGQPKVASLETNDFFEWILL